MEKIKVREDLNEIVTSIGFKHVENKYGVRNIVNVKLFNDAIIEFKDNDGIYELFQSYAQCGETDFIKSRELVEEIKKNDEGESVGTYICVKYVLKDDSVYRLFPSKFVYNKVIENYYNLFKTQKKAEMPKK